MKINHGEYQELVDNLKHKLLQTARKNLQGDKIKTVELAFDVADHAHYGQFRKSGEPYITHPIEVATFIAQWDLDEQTIAGALMHDVIEDTDVTKDELTRIFGESIAELVDSVTKLDKLHFESEIVAHAEYFRKVVLAMAKDVRVILIKLADRTHNMLTLGSMRRDKQKRIALETMEIYVPIANRIGLHKVHLQLAEESFKYLHPKRYEVLEKATTIAQQNRMVIIDEILSNIENALRSNAVKGEFKSRQRTIYNLYTRMQKRKASFNSIYDIFEMKIIVETIGDCYLALGVIHSLYQPIPGKFKDYVAVPKNNGYQSLHTTTMGPKGIPIQFHIRTQEMEEIAENGVISHWLKQSQGSDFSQAKKQTSNWLNNILDIQSSTFSATDFLDNIKKDLAPKNIYVFTPRGNIIHLPQGATPIDFAYAIHTDIGDHFHRAKVNQRYVRMDYKLQNGEIVEILTNPEGEPDSDWLNFVVSGKAISKIKQYMKEQKFDDDVQNGIRILTLGLHIAGCDIIVDQNILQNIIDLHYRGLNYDELMQKIGATEIPVLKVVREILNTPADEYLPIKLSNCNLALIQDDECCPLPGENTLARITKKGELELHFTKCIRKRIIGLDNLSLVTIVNDTDAKFMSKILVVIDNTPGTFNKLSSIIAERKINIEEIHQERTFDQKHVITNMIISIHDINEVENLIEDISARDFVERATHL